MLKFNKNKTELDIEYSKGDTFAFNIETESGVPTGSTLRMQISPCGDINDVIVDKKFEVNNNVFAVTLLESELIHLNVGNTYQYRFTFFDIEGNITTTTSGNLIVKWGA